MRVRRPAPRAARRRSKLESELRGRRVRKALPPPTSHRSDREYGVQTLKQCPPNLPGTKPNVRLIGLATGLCYHQLMFIDAGARGTVVYRYAFNPDATPGVDVQVPGTGRA
jgi:hypothetical protein